MSRPKLKPEFIEGPQASKNFSAAMKALFRVPKSEVQMAEKKYKASRRRKKSLRTMES
jgi:hypothetical protein